MGSQSPAPGQLKRTERAEWVEGGAQLAVTMPQWPTAACEAGAACPPRPRPARLGPQLVYGSAPEGHLQCRQLVQDAAQGPDVRRQAVRLPQEELRRGVAGSADLRSQGGRNRATRTSSLHLPHTAGFSSLREGRRGGGGAHPRRPCILLH